MEPTPTPEERIARARARRLAQNEEPQTTLGANTPPPPPPPVSTHSKASLQRNNILDAGKIDISQMQETFRGIKEENRRFLGLIGICLGCIVLLGSGLSDILSQSKGANSYHDEDSFMALQLRSIGYLKIGIGLLSGGFFALRL
jgi:hypothetical protein